MTNKIPDISFLTEQLSIPAADLVAPGPDKQQLEAILQSAMSAPDHGNLTPYRFLIIEGDARHALSDVFAEAARKRQLDDSAIEKQRQKPLRSPMIIAVVAQITDNPLIPEIEQLLSAGCAAQHIQLASRQLGFGSIWLTGDNCYDHHIYQALGLSIDERMVGFIYIGTPKAVPVKKNRPRAMARTRHWIAPQATDFAI